MAQILTDGSRSRLLGRRATAALAPPSANLAYWFKADALSLSDGDAVATWTDSSTNGKNATQAGAATLKPTYKANIVNGKPVVRFDGGDYLTFTAASFSVFTIYVVVRKQAVSAYNCFLYESGTSYAALSTSATSGGASCQIAASAVAASPAAAVDSWQLIRVQRPSSNDFYLAMNGTAGTPVNKSTAFAPSYIGYYDAAGYVLKGDVAEIIAYSASHEAADIATTQGYLAVKYGITVA